MTENNDRLLQLIQEEFAPKKEYTKDEKLKELIKREVFLMEQELINDAKDNSVLEEA